MKRDAVDQYARSLAQQALTLCQSAGVFAIVKGILTAASTIWNGGDPLQAVVSALAPTLQTSDANTHTILIGTLPNNAYTQVKCTVVAHSGASGASWDLSMGYNVSGGAVVDAGTVTTGESRGTNSGSPPGGWIATIVRNGSQISAQVQDTNGDTVRWAVVSQSFSVQT